MNPEDDAFYLRLVRTAASSTSALRATIDNATDLEIYRAVAQAGLTFPVGTRVTALRASLKQWLERNSGA